MGADYFGDTVSDFIMEVLNNKFINYLLHNLNIEPFGVITTSRNLEEPRHYRNSYFPNNFSITS